MEKKRHMLFSTILKFVHIVFVTQEKKEVVYEKE